MFNRSRLTLARKRRGLSKRQLAHLAGLGTRIITAYEAGVQNVTAPQGTAFTERQAQILKRYANEVILCFDADVAGLRFVGFMADLISKLALPRIPTLSVPRLFLKLRHALAIPLPT